MGAQASSQSFCLCSHARSLVMDSTHRHVCGVPACPCVRHQVAKARRFAVRLVEEPSPNARARDAAVLLLKAALTDSKTPFDDVRAALVCLEVIS